MQDWTKRVQSYKVSGRKAWEGGRKRASRTARQFGGRWLPNAMNGAASGLSSASKALNKSANRLRKNVKAS